MLSFLADEDFNNHIVGGLLRRLPQLDVVRAQDVGLIGRHDTKVLELAARDKRILLTHDADTMIEFAKNRVKSDLSMPGHCRNVPGLTNWRGDRRAYYFRFVQL